MGFDLRVEDLGVGFWVQALDSELKVLGFRVCGLVFKVYGLGCWGWGSGCGVWPLQLQAWGFAKLTFHLRLGT